MVKRSRLKRSSKKRMVRLSKLTMADVRRIHKEKGYYWFSPDTMRFFNSRVESELVGNKYFVSSEKSPFEGAVRLYSVRGFNSKTGDISTVGDFQGFKTRVEAMAHIKKLLGSD